MQWYYISIHLSPKIDGDCNAIIQDIFMDLLNGCLVPYKEQIGESDNDTLIFKLVLVLESECELF